MFQEQPNNKDQEKIRSQIQSEAKSYIKPIIDAKESNVDDHDTISYYENFIYSNLEDILWYKKRKNLEKRKIFVSYVMYSIIIVLTALVTTLFSFNAHILSGINYTIFFSIIGLLVSMSSALIIFARKKTKKIQNYTILLNEVEQEIICYNQKLGAYKYMPDKEAIHRFILKLTKIITYMKSDV